MSNGLDEGQSYQISRRTRWVGWESASMCRGPFFS